MPTYPDRLLLSVLKACADAPPLYAASFAEASGLDRGTLDGVLDQLRLQGFVCFTVWTQGRGQGYEMTPEGEQALREPALLHKPAAPMAPPRPQQEQADEMSVPGITRARMIRDIFLSPTRPVVTITLLILNFLMFFTGMEMARRQGAGAQNYLLGNDNDGIEKIYHDLGSVRNHDIVRHQWWRLLSYAFLHAGLLHIGCNMYFLFGVGPLLEKLWGAWRFLLIYLISAWAGGCLAVAYMPLNTVVGASGALCGMLASLGIWIVMQRPYLPPELFASWSRVVVTNIILIAVISMVPQVSWAGHLGGAIGGAIASIPMTWSRFGSTRLSRLLGLALVAAVPIAFYLLVVMQGMTPMGR